MDSQQATSKAHAITLAHSPDCDDAFMFYALATGKVRMPGLKFAHTLADIETLNQAARQEAYDVTAISFHAYPFLADKYVLLDSGASFGEGYGPIVVATHGLKPNALAGRRAGVAGLLTTSALLLKLFAPGVELVPMAFDKIMEAVRTGAVDAGLLIHEGQLLYSQQGFHKVVDLGQWWLKKTGMLLPLGGNAVRRALGPEVGCQVARAIQQSVSYALQHREAALNYAMQFARDLDADLADKFVGMYVNRWTLSLGQAGRQAVRELLAQGARAGLVPSLKEIDFLGGEGE